MKNNASLTPSSTLQVLRWIAVLPSCYFFAVLSIFPIHWVVMLIQSYGKSSDGARITIDPAFPLAAIPPEVLEGLLHAFFTPLFVIAVGATIVPYFKFQTGIVLAILWGILFATVVEKSFSQQGGWYFAWGWLGLALTCIFSACGIALGLYMAHAWQYPKLNPVDAPFTLTDKGNHPSE